MVTLCTVLFVWLLSKSLLPTRLYRLLWMTELPDTVRVISETSRNTIPCLSILAVGSEALIRNVLQYIAQSAVSTNTLRLDYRRKVLAV